ncbi:hypothetical protein D3C80_2159860 [compost metagenome]
MFIELEMAVQQIPLGCVRIAEQHHFGVQPFDRLQGAMGQLKAPDHRAITRLGRDV